MHIIQPQEQSHILNSASKKPNHHSSLKRNTEKKRSYTMANDQQLSSKKANSVNQTQLNNKKSLTLDMSYKKKEPSDYPGPSDYNLAPARSPRHMYSFGKSLRDSEIVQMRPSPQSYVPKKLSRTTMISFAKTMRKMHLNTDSPGPAIYRHELANVLSHSPKYSFSTSEKFRETRAFLEEQKKRPAPNSYYLQMLPKGGKTFFKQKKQLLSQTQNIGPADYNPTYTGRKYPNQVFGKMQRWGPKNMRVMTGMQECKYYFKSAK